MFDHASCVSMALPSFFLLKIDTSCCCTERKKNPATRGIACLYTLAEVYFQAFFEDFYDWFFFILANATFSKMNFSFLQNYGVIAFLGFA